MIVASLTVVVLSLVIVCAALLACLRRADRQIAGWRAAALSGASALQVTATALQATAARVIELQRELGSQRSLCNAQRDEILRLQQIEWRQRTDARPVWVVQGSDQVH